MNINCKGNLIDLTTPKIMGILNVTPNSFYDGGRYDTLDSALDQATKMLEEGARFVDIGGASSKPGVEEISETEELKRVIPIIEALHNNFPEAILSIDTYRSAVAKEAIEAGAHVVNDISAGNLDPAMLTTVGKLGVPYIAMHMQGTPQNMQDNPTYEDILVAIRYFFSNKVKEARNAGITDIILDPGFGFGKSIHDNFTLLRHLDSLRLEGVPLLVGVSRKSMIYKTLDIDAAASLNGTTVLNTIALNQGAQLLRVHDVKEAKEAIRLMEQLHAANPINP